MSDTKIRFGSGKTLTNQYGSMQSLYFSVKNLEEMLALVKEKNLKGLSLNVKEKREPDQYGNILYCEVYEKKQPF
jgi:hypothetical protein